MLPPTAMTHDSRDFALRALILVAGVLSAILLAMQGHGDALPAVAIGGALGAFFATRVQQTTSEE
jgi:hypothetical protein